MIGSRRFEEGSRQAIIPQRTWGALGLPSLLAVPAAFVFLLNVMAQRPLFIDDAYIFYRYATNWADGYGPVFNSGEHVEGYSSLLWTAVLALGARLSVTPDVLAPALGLVLGGLSLVLLSRLTRSLLPGMPFLSVALPLAAALSSGLAAFALSGMDTILFVVALLAATVAVTESAQSGHALMLGITLPLLIAARAEGVLYALAFLAVLGVLLHLGQTALDSVRYWRVVITSILAIVLLSSFRLIYYGDLLPATVMAKGYAGHALMTMDLGALRDALERGLVYERETIALVALPLVALVIRSRRQDRQTPIAWLIATPVVVNIVITALSSGDWMPYHRLNIAVWPMVLLLVAWELTNIVRDPAWSDGGRSTPGRSPYAPVVAVAVICFGAFSVQGSVGAPSISNLLNHDDSAGFNMDVRQVGLLFHEVEPAPSVLSDVIGELSYYSGSDVYVWDMYGLTDEHNSKHGNRWTPSVGRSDDAYNNSRPFDVLVTNDPATLERLFEYWQAHPELGGIDSYVAFPSEQWLNDSFFVVARIAHPVASRLQSLCDCTPVTLTAEFIHDQRPPWKTGRFGEPPQ